MRWRCFTGIVLPGHWRSRGNTPWIFKGYNVIDIWRIGGLLCLVGCAHAPGASSPPTPSPGAAHYTVTIFDNFGGARVRVCLEGAPVRELVPIDDSGGRGLRGAWSDGEALDISNGRIRLSQTSRTSCFDYQTRFAELSFRAGDSAAVVLSQAEWLWRPDPYPPELEVSVSFVVPEGGQVSLPWPRSDGVYFPARSAFFSSTYSVFGSFDRQAFSVAGTVVDVARLGDRPTDEDVRRWLGRAVEATASVGHRFPRDRLHFVIVPLDIPGEEVAFGMLRRGGGSSILLLPSLGATVDQLEADWVAIHELSHLWLPRFYPKDRWLSEGMATYLQEVLRARCGLQSSEHAWKRLHEGFARGRRSGTGRRLSSESRNMNRTGAYHRVYWAGAAFALEADVRLRKNSKSEMTLLRALSEAQHAWGDEAGPMKTSVLFEALQEASGAGFLKGLAEKYAASSDFPNTAYLDSPEYRQVRAQIMSDTDGACGINAESSP